MGQAALVLRAAGDYDRRGLKVRLTYAHKLLITEVDREDAILGLAQDETR